MEPSTGVGYKMNNEKKELEGFELADLEMDLEQIDTAFRFGEPRGGIAE